MYYLAIIARTDLIPLALSSTTSFLSVAIPGSLLTLLLFLTIALPSYLLIFLENWVRKFIEDHTNKENNENENLGNGENKACRSTPGLSIIICLVSLMISSILLFSYSLIDISFFETPFPIAFIIAITISFIYPYVILSHIQKKLKKTEESALGIYATSAFITLSAFVIFNIPIKIVNPEPGFWTYVYIFFFPFICTIPGSITILSKSITHERNQTPLFFIAGLLLMLLTLIVTTYNPMPLFVYQSAKTLGIWKDKPRTFYLPRSIPLFKTTTKESTTDFLLNEKENSINGKILLSLGDSILLCPRDTDFSFHAIQREGATNGCLYINERHLIRGAPALISPEGGEAGS